MRRPVLTVVAALSSVAAAAQVVVSPIPGDEATVTLAAAMPAAGVFGYAALAGGVAASGTKDLVESTPTEFLLYLSDDSADPYTGGVVEWCVDASDATDFQHYCGISTFTQLNKGGTVGCSVSTSGACAASKGVTHDCTDVSDTLTVTITVAASGSGCNMLANAASDLTQTSLRVNYTARTSTALARNVQSVP